MHKFLLWCSCTQCKCLMTTQSLSQHVTKHSPTLKSECEECGAGIFLYRQRFCSHSCAARNNNRRRGCKPQKPKITKQQRFEKWISDWKSNLIRMESTYSGPDNQISSRIKRYLLEQTKYTCSKCGWHEVNPKTGLVPVQINHIDGDSTNNHPENLEVLCPNCHSLTPTFGCHGKGRKKRYAGLA